MTKKECMDITGRPNTIRPVWGQGLGKGGRTYKAERQIGPRLVISRLAITFSPEQRYNDQLSLQVKHVGLEFFLPGERPTVVCFVPIDGKGKMTTKSGTINIHQPGKISADQILPGFEPTAKSLDQPSVQPFEFWNKAGAGALTTSNIRSGEVDLVLAVGPDSVYLTALRSGGIKIAPMGKGVLGLLAAQSGKAEEYLGHVVMAPDETTIEVAERVPALNWGPRMSQLIADKLTGSWSEEDLQVLFLEPKPAFKALILFAHDYLTRPELSREVVSRTLYLLTEGVRNLNSDSFYEQSPALTAARDRLVAEVAFVLIDFTKRPQAESTSLANIVREMARKLMESWTQAQAVLISRRAQ
jgi:hypothetical protein